MNLRPSADDHAGFVGNAVKQATEPGRTFLRLRMRVSDARIKMAAADLEDAHLRMDGREGPGDLVRRARNGWLDALVPERGLHGTVEAGREDGLREPAGHQSGDGAMRIGGSLVPLLTFTARWFPATTRKPLSFGGGPGQPVEESGTVRRRAEFPVMPFIGRRPSGLSVKRRQPPCQAEGGFPSRGDVRRPGHAGARKKRVSAGIGARWKGGRMDRFDHGPAGRPVRRVCLDEGPAGSSHG